MIVPKGRAREVLEHPPLAVSASQLSRLVVLAALYSCACAFCSAQRTPN
jgi:hypothetical protein